MLALVSHLAPELTKNQLYGKIHHHTKHPILKEHVITKEAKPSEESTKQINAGGVQQIGCGALKDGARKRLGTWEVSAKRILKEVVGKRKRRGKEKRQILIPHQP